MCIPRQNLSPDHVDFILKTDSVDYSNLEIARRLGVTEGAIHYRVKRALLEEERLQAGEALQKSPGLPQGILASSRK